MEQGSTASESTPHDTHALDELEFHVLHFLRGDSDALSAAELRQAIDASERLHPGLYSEPPPIDPSEGRHSTAEILRILAMLDGASSEVTHLRTRAGYALGPKGFRAGEPGVEPAFVAALGARNLRQTFPDLWAVDALVWGKLDASPPKELARLWLESPGRRLVQDLSAIAIMPQGGRLGATDFSSERIDAAVGLARIAERKVPAPLRAHHELYLAVAGETYLELWEPKPLPEEKTQQILRALNLLEDGRPLGLRGAALRWLLDEAVDKPHYTVDGVRRDLRDDLSMRLGTALPSWLSDTPEATTSRRLETLALHHAAQFIGTDSSEQATQRAWAIARWLQGCLRRSPFFGGDEEVLAAHLEARLSTSNPALPNDADALHPLRFSVDFSTDGAGLNVAEVAFVAGMIVHYQQPREHQLLPTPMPLVHALQRLADRPVRDAEVAADKARLAGRNALGWPKDYPLMLPVTARRLMSELRIGWLGAIGIDAQIDTIERFRTEPQRYKWMAFALQREGKHLVAEARSRAAEVFRELASNDRVEPHVFGTFAAGILGELSDEEVATVLDIAQRSEPRWGPFVVDVVADALNPNQKNQLWTLAIERLIMWMEDSSLDEKMRLNAALFAMRRVSASTALNRTQLHQRLAASAVGPPFSTHVGLQAELRRLGLSKANIRGTKS